MDDVVLTTGAAGAIGSATVNAFLTAGFSVVGLDRDPSVTSVAEDRYLGIQVDVDDGPAVAAAIDAHANSGGWPIWSASPVAPSPRNRRLRTTRSCPGRTSSGPPSSRTSPRSSW